MGTATGNSTNNEGLELVVTDEGVHGAKEGQTKEIVRSPAQQFTDQAKALRKLGKEKNIRDTKDALRGITYRLFLDPRLQPPDFIMDVVSRLSKYPHLPPLHQQRPP